MRRRKPLKNVAATRRRRIKQRAPRTKPADVPRALNLGALERLYAEGLIDRRVAAALGVSERTLNRYKLAPAVMTVVEAGRKEFKGKVVHALHRRATGYEYAEVTMEPVMAVRQVAGEKQKVMVSSELSVTKIVTKHMPADVSAAQFYLTNRDPDNWKQRVDLTSGGKTIEPASFAVPAFGGYAYRAVHDSK